MNLPPRTEVKRGITQPWGSHFQHPCSECVDTRYFICRSYFLRPRKLPPRRAAPLLPLQQMNVDKIDLARARLPSHSDTHSVSHSLTLLPSFVSSLFLPSLLWEKPIYSFHAACHSFFQPVRRFGILSLLFPVYERTKAFAFILVGTGRIRAKGRKAEL